jgi:hypothetical protein
MIRVLVILPITGFLAVASLPLIGFWIVRRRYGIYGKGAGKTVVAYYTTMSVCVCFLVVVSKLDFLGRPGVADVVTTALGSVAAILLLSLTLMSPSLAMGLVAKAKENKKADTSEAPICACCGYNLTGNVSGVCPECGTTIDTHRSDEAEMKQGENGQERSSSA